AEDGVAISGALAGSGHASLVPTQLWRLLNDDGVPERLRAVLLGGATIPVELTHAAQQRGISCFCGYGMTELASTVCGKAADGLPDVGAPLAGREVREVDNEVWIRAAGMASGYWLDGAVRPVTSAHGWFATRARGEIG
ncbi:AMP-binding protein, partial [Leptospira borgpetersenii serovar Hardjo-bovis]|nr:AMP-binding protein [Leptospira borgpetersenii serovar Hardjo-bovis]